MRLRPSARAGPRCAAGAAVTPRDVAVFVPNLITYARAALLLGVPALDAASRPLAAAALYAASAALDGLDGAAARALGQATRFGAFADVAADNAGRALLWALAAANGGAPAALAALAPALEGLTFAASQAATSPEWKAQAFAAVQPSSFVAFLSRNAFRTPQGCALMAGLHFAPLALYLRPAAAAGGWAGAVWWRAALAALVAARLAAAALELWLLRRHAAALLHADAADRA